MKILPKCLFELDVHQVYGDCGNCGNCAYTIIWIIAITQDIVINALIIINENRLPFRLKATFWYMGSIDPTKLKFKISTLTH